MDCLFCEEPIKDGEEVIDGQIGDAIVRDEEPEWTGEMTYGSQFFTVHRKCFEKAQDNFNKVTE